MAKEDMIPERELEVILGVKSTCNIYVHQYAVSSLTLKNNAKQIPNSYDACDYYLNMIPPMRFAEILV